MDASDNERERRVQPELHSLHSPDLRDMHASLPEDPENFCMLVQAFIGSRGDPGEDTFDFLVCTPTRIYLKLADQAVIFGRHYVFIQRYDYDLIVETIERLCASISGATWREVAERLGRYGKWEFEDYRPYREET